MDKVNERTTGLVLGKFMPLHRGHQYLIEFADQYVDYLYVLVCSLERDPIPGIVRYDWVREMCHPRITVGWVVGEVPQEPSEHPDFWQIWREIIRRYCGDLDYVFTSEEYGWNLAAVLGSQHIPVDPSRSNVPVSGTAIRENPMKFWRYLPEVVRPYYVKRVCIFGAESTGKSTLARDLATHFDTVCVDEYARGLLDHKGGKCDPEDIPLIAKGQMVSEDVLAKQANRLLVCDTDMLTTTIWADMLFGSCPEWVREEAGSRQYDLTLVMDIDVPWIDDTQRFHPHRRQWFMDESIRRLESHDRKYVVIGGSWKERFGKAIDAIQSMKGV